MGNDREDEIEIKLGWGEGGSCISCGPEPNMAHYSRSHPPRVALGSCLLTVETSGNKVQKLSVAYTNACFWA
jgi:hypothetical protein